MEQQRVRRGHACPTSGLRSLAGKTVPYLYRTARSTSTALHPWCDGDEERQSSHALSRSPPSPRFQVPRRRFVAQLLPLCYPTSGILFESWGNSQWRGLAVEQLPTGRGCLGRRDDRHRRSFAVSDQGVLGSGITDVATLVSSRMDAFEVIFHQERSSDRSLHSPLSCLAFNMHNIIILVGHRLM